MPHNYPLASVNVSNGQSALCTVTHARLARTFEAETVNAAGRLGSQTAKTGCRGSGSAGIWIRHVGLDSFTRFHSGPKANSKKGSSQDSEILCTPTTDKQLIFITLPTAQSKRKTSPVIDVATA